MRGREGEVRTGRGQGQVTQGLVGHWWTQAFTPREAGALRATNSREIRSDLGDNRHPLMVTSERMDCGGGLWWKQGDQGGEDSTGPGAP